MIYKGTYTHMLDLFQVISCAYRLQLRSFSSFSNKVNVVKLSFKNFAWEDQSKNQCYICHIAPETRLEYYITI